jgi:hypothetical protein
LLLDRREHVKLPRLFKMDFYISICESIVHEMNC